MGPGDVANIAKDAIRIATTAGLSKDVIDLLEKKIALLTEQITTLEAENSDLNKKAANLEQQLGCLRPTGDLHEDSVRFLKLLYDIQKLPIRSIAGLLRIVVQKAEYHRDKLIEAKMISFEQALGLGDDTPLLLEPKGRAYLIENGLV